MVQRSSEVFSVAIDPESRLYQKGFSSDVPRSRFQAAFCGRMFFGISWDLPRHVTFPCFSNVCFCHLARNSVSSHAVLQCAGAALAEGSEKRHVFACRELNDEMLGQT